jgi:hypothetical protein
MRAMTARRWLKIFLVVLVVNTGCNSPPLYESKARRFLESRKVPSETIEKLVTRQPLETSEVTRLMQFTDIAVLHLVGSNPGTSEELLRRLAQHRNLEVRTGVAGNANAPLELLLRLRVKGRYDTVNEYLASNPKIPSEVLLDMKRRNEAGYGSFARNSNCPREVMGEILRKGSEIEKAWLAANPNLSDEHAQRLSKEPSNIIRNYLAQNPRHGHLVKDGQ